jgi:Sigma-70, region 4
MDETLQFCARMLGDRSLAERAAHGAQQTGGDRMHALAAAVAACRQFSDQAAIPATDSNSGAEHGLVGAIASEMAQATARLPQRQREALALRETLGLGYDDIGRLIGIEPAAVAPLLARARLRLRSELRGTPPPAGDCLERDRALRTIARRRDGEEVLDADEEWLLDHLGQCPHCAQAHSAMLEASACYRAWQLPETAAT